jgi:hypothetical protein
LLINTKIASAKMNVTSPTGDAVIIATATTSLRSHTVKCRFHSLTGPRPIRSSRRTFTGLIPSGCVNPGSTNEKARKGNRSQCNSRRSDVSPSLPRENANAQAASTDNMGNRDEPHRTLHTHVWRRGKGENFIETTTEILIKKK